jgi:hypothetical protein
MNLLVPYLDLFERLSDDELGRLAGVAPAVAATLRVQVDEIGRALARYVDLLPRLSDTELQRLTGASSKTIRFWRLCQARATALAAPRETPALRTRHAMTTGGVATVGVPSELPVSRTPPPMTLPSATSPAASGFPTEDEVALEVGLLDEPARPSPEPRRASKAEELADELSFELSDDDFL